MNRELLRCFVLVLALGVSLGALGCTGDAASPEDVSVAADAPLTGAPAATGGRPTPVDSIHEELGLVTTHPLGTQLGPEPDPWTRSQGTGTAGGPEPDPWTPKARQVVVTASDPNAASTTTGKH